MLLWHSFLIIIIIIIHTSQRAETVCNIYYYKFARSQGRLSTSCSELTVKVCNSSGNSLTSLTPGLTRKGDWLSLRTQEIISKNMTVHDPSVCVPSPVVQVHSWNNDVDDSTYSSSEFQRLIILSIAVGPGCLSWVLNVLFFSFSKWPRVLLLVSNSKKFSQSINILLTSRSTITEVDVTQHCWVESEFNGTFAFTLTGRLMFLLIPVAVER